MHARGRSDTEVLLRASRTRRPMTALLRVDGMFALALWVWDRHSWILTRVRDRLGERPLVYGQSEGARVLASRLSTFLRLPGPWHDQDRPALAAYVQLGLVQASRTTLKGYTKGPPGCMVRVTIATPEQAVPHWSFAKRPTCDGVMTCPTKRLSTRTRQSWRVQYKHDSSPVFSSTFLLGSVKASTVVALAPNASSPTCAPSPSLSGDKRRPPECSAPGMWPLVRCRPLGGVPTRRADNSTPLMDALYGRHGTVVTRDRTHREGGQR